MKRWPSYDKHGNEVSEMTLKERKDSNGSSGIDGINGTQLHLLSMVAYSIRTAALLPFDQYHYHQEEVMQPLIAAYSAASNYNPTGWERDLLPFGPDLDQIIEEWS
jgi:hypothetical protein